MKKRLLYTFLFICLLGLAIVAIPKCPDDGLSPENNIEALNEGEIINVITCLPEQGSICISDIEDVIMINHYFSPH